ncbi:MAG TPA: hypothetical protein VMA37_06595 [Acetobacteraceae bacterium]|nr:hypothetical protein [Acetobacteraceae bacterium]
MSSSVLQFSAQQLGPKAGYVQTPRFAILLNGVPVQWPLSVSVTSNNYSEASRFACSFAIGQDDANNLSGMASIPVDIQVSLAANEPATLISGITDNIEIDPITLHATLSGRDYAALLIDTMTQQTYSNMTASQVIEALVAEHSAEGLKGNITATSELVGRFYGGTDYSMTFYGQLYRATNEWDLALMLAQASGFDLRLGGPTASGAVIDAKTLYFGPPVPQESILFDVAIEYPANGGSPISNAEHLRFMRSLTLAKDVEVTAIGWNSALMKPLTSTITARNVLAPSGGNGPPQKYVVRVPGDATPEQVLQYAQAKIREITAFERVIEIKVPGELALTPANPVRLVGSGTQFDQTYFIDEIVRTLSFSGGFHETVRLKNHSPYNQTIVQ